MKKILFLLSVLVVSLVVGCGGPNYANGFKEWLGNSVAKNGPLKLAWVKIEKLSSGKTEAVFKFTCEVQITENQYGSVGSDDIAPALAALKKMREANVPVPQQNEVTALYNEMMTMRLPVYKIVTPEGKRVSMSGKAQATLLNNGAWEYELLDVVGGNYPVGKEPTGKWAREESKEAKENAAQVQEKVAAVVAAADKAIQEARESQAREDKFNELVRRKEAEAAKAQEAAFLAFCDEGQVVYGSWTSETASGDIGIRWGQRSKNGDGYSIAGVFFDPDNQQYQKPFTGRITISDSPNVPYNLELKALGGKGVQISDGLWFSVIGAQGRKAAIDAGVFDKPPVLLLERFSYNVVLEYSSSGELQGTSTFDSTGVQRPKYQFSKSYKPRKGTADTPSSFIPKPSEPSEQAIQQIGGQSSNSSAGGGKYRMSVAELKAQLAASKPLVGEYQAAMQRMDIQAGRKYLNELVRKYPQCPITLFLQMGEAFMAKDIPQAQKIYNILMTEYPDTEGMRAAYTASYEGYLRTVQSGR